MELEPRKHAALEIDSYWSDLLVVILISVSKYIGFPSRSVSGAEGVGMASIHRLTTKHVLVRPPNIHTHF